MNKALGVWGENQAEKYLVKNGYRVVKRNFRVFEGEIDVVAEKRDRIVFVEVKTRTTDRFGSPEESVSAQKRSRLYLAGMRYLEEQGYSERECQFDLIAIECTAAREVLRITHYEDIIDDPGWR